MRLFHKYPLWVYSYKKEKGKKESLLSKNDYKLKEMGENNLHP